MPDWSMMSGTGAVIDVDSGDAIDWLLVDKDDRSLRRKRKSTAGHERSHR
jgi:hypothetical protein